MDNTIFRLGKNILKRYEHNFKGGTIFLYDVITRDLWIGNASSYDIIQLIDGKNTLSEIYKKLLPAYSMYSEKEAIDSFNSIISELQEKGFVEKISLDK